MTSKKPLKKITKKMTFAELLEMKPESAEVLMESGMHCFGCPMSQMETIEQGAMAHGMTKKEIDELMKKIEGLSNKDEKKNKETKNKTKEDYILELEDMIYGFENYKELRPNKKRINALKEIQEKVSDEVIGEILKIFESGHGVLSKPVRTKSLKNALEVLK